MTNHQIAARYVTKMRTSDKNGILRRMGIARDASLPNDLERDKAFLREVFAAGRQDELLREIEAAEARAAR